MPALLGSLTVSVVYLIMWESVYATPACVVASGLGLLDNAHIAQTRLIFRRDPRLYHGLQSTLLYQVLQA
jgi:dolichyl-phosphate-mannose--protein O-mannosyl transferase